MPPSLLLSEYPIIISCVFPRNARCDLYKGRSKSERIISLERSRSSIVSNRGTISIRELRILPSATETRPASFAIRSAASMSLICSVFDTMYDPMEFSSAFTAAHAMTSNSSSAFAADGSRGRRGWYKGRWLEISRINTACFSFSASRWKDFSTSVIRKSSATDCRRTRAFCLTSSRAKEKRNA